MLSADDQALIKELMPVVEAKIGVTTLASVVRYALRQTVRSERAKRRKRHP